MGNSFCDSQMTKDVFPGTNVVKNCSTNYTQSCTTGGGGTTYPGDANSCPGFSYSRWDTQNRRYCQLNSERKCDYSYPSYLTNGPNYNKVILPLGSRQ